MRTSGSRRARRALPRVALAAKPRLRELAHLVATRPAAQQPAGRTLDPRTGGCTTRGETSRILTPPTRRDGRPNAVAMRTSVKWWSCRSPLRPMSRAHDGAARPARRASRLRPAQPVARPRGSRRDPPRRSRPRGLAERERLDHDEAERLPFGGVDEHVERVDPRVRVRAVARRTRRGRRCRAAWPARAVPRRRRGGSRGSRRRSPRSGHRGARPRRGRRHAGTGPGACRARAARDPDERRCPRRRAPRGPGADAAPGGHLVDGDAEWDLDGVQARRRARAVRRGRRRCCKRPPPRRPSRPAALRRRGIGEVLLPPHARAPGAHRRWARRRAGRATCSPHHVAVARQLGDPRRTASRPVAMRRTSVPASQSSSGPGSSSDRGVPAGLRAAAGPRAASARSAPPRLAVALTSRTRLTGTPEALSPRGATRRRPSASTSEPARRRRPRDSSSSGSPR